MSSARPTTSRSPKSVPRPPAQRVDVLDAATGAVLDSRSVSAFSGGTWMSWDLSGRVKLRVVNGVGYNAVLSALTFDTPAAAPPAAPSGLSAAAEIRRIPAALRPRDDTHNAQ